MQLFIRITIRRKIWIVFLYTFDHTGFRKLWLKALSSNTLEFSLIEDEVFNSFSILIWNKVEFSCMRLHCYCMYGLWDYPWSRQIVNFTRSYGCPQFSIIIESLKACVLRWHCQCVRPWRLKLWRFLMFLELLTLCYWEYSWIESLNLERYYGSAMQNLFML